MKYYEFLKKVFQKISSIESTIKVLSCSKLNVESKIEQVGLLEELKHEIISHDLVKEALSSEESGLAGAEIRNLECIKKVHRNCSVLTADLAKSLSIAKIECVNLWSLGRSDTSYLGKLKEQFTNLIKLVQEAASIKSENLSCSKYDTILANYSYEITEDDIKKIFPEIGKFCSTNNGIIQEKQNKKKNFNIESVSIDKQIELSKLYLNKLGITTEELGTFPNLPICYDESNFCCGLSLVLRRSSDVMYEKQLAQNFIMTDQLVREMQGMFIEKILGTSKEFIRFIQPGIKSLIKSRVYSVDNLHSIFNKVNFSPSLENSDELTTLSHVMLRTKLEQNIIDGSLEVADLHDAWLNGMKYYNIPIEAESEMDTYFQDKYWASGMMGYFPLKVIALVAAVQIFSFIRQDCPKCLGAIVKGNFNLLVKWLSENIYNTQYGMLKSLEKITGKGLDVECYVNYLSKKYDLA